MAHLVDVSGITLPVWLFGALLFSCFLLVHRFVLEVGLRSETTGRGHGDDLKWLTFPASLLADVSAPNSGSNPEGVYLPWWALVVIFVFLFFLTLYLLSKLYFGPKIADWTSTKIKAKLIVPGTLEHPIAMFEDYIFCAFLWDVSLNRLRMLFRKDDGSWWGDYDEPWSECVCKLKFFVLFSRSSKRRPGPCVDRRSTWSSWHDQCILIAVLIKRSYPISCNLRLFPKPDQWQHFYRHSWRVIATVVGGLLGYLIGWLVGLEALENQGHPYGFELSTILWYVLAVAGAVCGIALLAWQWCSYRWKKWGREHPHVEPSKSEEKRSKEEKIPIWERMKKKKKVGTSKIPYQIIPFDSVQDAEEYVHGIYTADPEATKGIPENELPDVSTLEPIIVNREEFKANEEAHRNRAIRLRSPIKHVDNETKQPLTRLVSRSAIFALFDIRTFQAILERIVDTDASNEIINKTNKRLAEQTVALKALNLTEFDRFVSKVEGMLAAIAPKRVDEFGATVTADETPEQMLPVLLKMLPKLREYLLQLEAVVNITRASSED